MNTFVSPSTLPLRFDPNASFRPSGEIAKPFRAGSFPGFADAGTRISSFKRGADTTALEGVIAPLRVIRAARPSRPVVLALTFRGSRAIPAGVALTSPAR